MCSWIARAVGFSGSAMKSGDESVHEAGCAKRWGDLRHALAIAAASYLVGQVSIILRRSFGDIRQHYLMFRAG